MGFFSWKTADTEESISNAYSCKGALEVKMIDNKGNTWEEFNYEGYGVFGGKDYYELLSEMNGKGSNRGKGCDLAFGETKCLKPKLVSIDCELKFEDLPDSQNCEFQGFFY